MPNNKQKTVALVVGYYPDLKITYNLLKSLSEQVDSLVLIDNGGSNDVYTFSKKQNINIHYINLEKNKGLGYALNIGFEYAIDIEAKYVATFDQDSSPPSNLISKLKQAHIQLENKNINCAAVSPVFFDHRESIKKYFPFYIEKAGKIIAQIPEKSTDNLVKSDTLITSGMLIKADAWKNDLRYDDELFIDYTDTEWCFRARSKGYSLFGCFNVEMGHAPSDAPPLRIFGLSFFHYSPLRRYYYFRNTIKFCRCDYVSWAWRRRLIYGLGARFIINALIDTKTSLSLKMMLHGIYDGLYKKNGKFDGEAI